MLAALNYASRYAVEDVGVATEDYFYRWDFFAGGAFQLVVMSAVLYWIVRRGPATRLLALRWPRSWGRAVGLMFVVLVAVLAVGALLNPFLHPGEEQGLVPERWRPDEATPFAFNLALTALAVPVVEELVFRGAGYSLLARYGRGAAILGTGVLFAVAHGLVVALPVLVVFGAGLAWIRSRSDSVVPGMILHGLFNTFSVLVGVFG